MKRIIVFIFAVSVAFSSAAQNVNPETGEIFREFEISIIRLTMKAEDKAFMLDDANIWSNEYLPTSFQFKNSLIDTTLAFQVGIRLRGNTSRNHPKRSFKIDFKEFGGKKFFDNKKFNLKAQNNDPTMTRQMLVLRMFRNANIAATRSHHTEVYINDEYMGLYLNVEQIDDEFVQSRFDNDSGNLYKCFWGANLRDDGQVDKDQVYTLKTNEEINDRTILNNFVSVLNNTSPEQLEEELEKVFNVTSFIKYLAIEVLSGHWDGYSYNKNNFYLYENNATGLVEFIPYDVDNTFGIDWLDRDWAKRDILDWANHGDSRPLTTRLLSRPKYLLQFKQNIQELLDGNFSEEYLFPEFDKYKNLLADAIKRDTYFPQKFGYTFDDFQNGFETSVAAHAPYGLKSFVSTRASLARQQLGIILGGSEGEYFSTFLLYPNPSEGQYIHFRINKNYTNLSITDVTGKNHNYQTSNWTSDDQRIDFNLAAGVYLLRIDEQVSRFIVKK